MIAITHSMDLKWPFYVDNYLNISTQFGSPGDVISLDCVLKDENVSMPSIHVKALIAVVFPFAIMTFIVIALMLLNIIKKKSQKNRVFISFIVMSIFLQPTILQILFDNLNYTTINNVQYLTKNLMIRYDDGEHQRWVFYEIKIIFSINFFFRFSSSSCHFLFFGGRYTLFIAFIICSSTGKIWIPMCSDPKWAFSLMDTKMNFIIGYINSISL